MSSNSDSGNGHARRISNEEIEKHKAVIDLRIECLEEKFATFQKGIYSEIKHRHEDSINLIQKEEEARKAADDKHETQTEAKSNLLLYLISGAFSSMGLLAGAMFYLISDVEKKILLELCQQGQYLNLKAYSLFNKVAVALQAEDSNNLLPILTEQIIPNCHII